MVGYKIAIKSRLRSAIHAKVAFPCQRVEALRGCWKYVRRFDARIHSPKFEMRTSRKLCYRGSKYTEAHCGALENALVL